MTTTAGVHKTLKLPEFNILTLVVFYITIIECRLQDIPHGSLTDLNVETIVFGKDGLQANISWKSADLQGRKLDVGLIPVVDEYCTNRKPCREYGLLSNVTEILLPKNPLIELEHHECSVMAGCSYEVKIETADLTIKQTTNYTVPDCVSDVCSCKHEHKLPTMFLNATVDSQNLKIYWRVNESSENVSLSSVFISVHYQSNPSLRWGGQTKQLDVDHIQLQNTTNNTEIDDGYHYVDLTKEMINATEFGLLVRAHVVDHIGCEGKESNVTYKVLPNRKLTIVYASNSYVKLFFIFFSVVIVLLVIGFTLTYRHIQHLLQTKSFVKNWRGIYQNVPNVGFRAIKFQENFLYGEAFQHCEIPHSALKFSHNIGKGNFGSVYLAVADGIGPANNSGLVAVKKLKKNHNIEEKDEFLEEIATMKKVSHPNIVALIGYCTTKQPMFIVMEYVGCGDLLNYLRRLREQHESKMSAINRMLCQQRKPTTNRHITNSSTSSTINLLSQSSNVNKSIKTYTNLSKGGCNSNRTSVSSLNNNPITVTTLNKLEMEVNYLELCHSSSSYSDASCSTKPESIASTKRISDTDNYTVFPQAISLECVLDHKELHCFAVQIARGMRHLEERRIIHRDLAARNILIDENKQLKISDFGLSKTTIYVAQRTKKVPIRWMAIEALRESVYTDKSDVWSFGVVLWEIGTLGGIPYANLSNELLLKYLVDGYRMPRPEICSEQLYKLMQQCWSESPFNRPSFSEIVQRLENTERDEHIYVNFDEIAPNYVFPPTRVTESDKTDKTSAD
ncbi:mast/stem cell growth factor receptor kita-like [Contarinia nasturtii]|uniref:mast/stem cell growth factor receptor kita-like n=1 Tax=Contarinia nasturtii TaxID=265458 RepID=UPI0012D38DBE|nr:mast/stem cell growth factor receptor kita-like [Contarinia nasturtii]XP_031623797.1 mast/stem cell growth factor receptor kita-like [Contarinia nasturtii]